MTSLLLPQMSMFLKSSLWAFSESKRPRGFNLLAVSSIVSIFCIGMAHPAMSTSRRLPYSSYFPSHMSSVFLVLKGCGLSGPYVVLFFDMFLTNSPRRPHTYKLVQLSDIL